MTDTDKIYVYTGNQSGYTNGNWYYYSGSTWVSGGVYNSVAIEVDDIPVQGSVNPVTSGGTWSAINAERKYFNLFNFESSEIVALNINVTTLKFGNSSTAKSVIFACQPNTTYSIAWRYSSSSANARYFVGTSDVLPTAGVKANTKYELTTEINGNRKSGVITTSETEKYMLFWFFTGNAGYDAIFKSIQVNEGNIINDYVPFGYTEPKEVVNTNQLYGKPVTTTLLPNYIIDNLGYKALGTLDKGYICIVADDGTTDVANVSFPIIRQKEIPITFALWTESQCITDITLRNQLKSLINDYGCSVCQHGGGSFVGDYTPEELITYLQSEQNKWSEFDITVKGLAYPNHDNNAAVRAVCGSLYDVCCAGGIDSNKDHVYENDTLGEFSNIFALYRVSTTSTTLINLKIACDYAIANKKLLILFYHDNSIANNQAQIDKINNVIDYAKEIGLTFITVGDIYNIAGKESSFDTGVYGIANELYGGKIVKNITGELITPRAYNNNNGTIIDSYPNAAGTDRYLPIIKEATYYYTGRIYQHVGGIVFYDANKAFLSAPFTGTQELVKEPIVIPEGAAYLNASTQQNVTNPLRLEVAYVVQPLREELQTQIDSIDENISNIKDIVINNKTIISNLENLTGATWYTDTKDYTTFGQEETKMLFNAYNGDELKIKITAPSSFLPGDNKNIRGYFIINDTRITFGTFEVNKDFTIKLNQDINGICFYKSDTSAATVTIDIEVINQSDGLIYDIDINKKQINTLHNKIEKSRIFENTVFQWSEIKAGQYGWQTGYYNADTGIYANSYNYICTANPEFITFNNAVTITATAPENYAIAIYEYDENGVFITRHGKANSSDADSTQNITIMIDQNHQYRFTIGNLSGQATNFLTSDFINNIILTVQDSVTPIIKNRVDNIEKQLELINTIESTNLYDKIANVLLVRHELPTYYTDFPTDPNSFDDISYIDKKSLNIPNGKHFFFITDTHWESNTKNSAILLNYLKGEQNIHTCIFGGDFIDRQENKYLANQIMNQFAKEYFSVFGNNFFLVYGNHDQNLANYLPSEHTSSEMENMFLPYEKVYNCFIKPCKNKIHTYWDDYGNRILQMIDEQASSVNKTQIESYGHLSYYYDDDIQKIRYIVIACYVKPDYGAWYDFFGDDSYKPYINWLYDILLSVKTNYDVVFITHQMGDPETLGEHYNEPSQFFSQMLMALKLNTIKQIYATFGTENEKAFRPQTRSFTVDFTHANKIGRVCMLIGHHHRDYLQIINQDSQRNDYVIRTSYDGNVIDQTLDTSENYHGCPIPVIYTTCDAVYRRSNIGTAQTVTEQAFDIVTFSDTGIDLTRIGAGEDRHIEMIW